MRPDSADAWMPRLDDRADLSHRRL